MMTAGMTQALSAICGADGVRQGDAVTLLDPGADAHNLDSGLVVFPRSVEEVQALVRLCLAHGLAIVPHGGRTGLAGGGVSRPGQVVCSLSRMNRILSIDPVSRLAIVEAGVTLSALDEALAPHGLMPGIDLGARDSATIGGMISTNAGGIEAFRHGVMRARVSGLEAVLADGSLMSDMSQVGKCNEGYDVKQLFIGAEGTLGIVTRAVLHVVPRPAGRATALVSAPSFSNALAAFRSIEAASLLAFELMSARYIALAAHDHGVSLPFDTGCHCFVVEVEGADETQAMQRLERHLEQSLEQGWIADAVIAKSEQERRVFWKLREDSWAVDRAWPGGLWFDVTVPLPRLDSYVAELEQGLSGLSTHPSLYIVGHLGDGNLHLTITGPQSPVPDKDRISQLVYKGLKAMGGSFSAEHGIGLEKRAALQTYGDAGKRAVLLAVKHALDPASIMNPGKVL